MGVVYYGSTAVSAIIRSAALVGGATEGVLTYSYAQQARQAFNFWYPKLCTNSAEWGVFRPAYFLTSTLEHLKLSPLI